MSEKVETKGKFSINKGKKTINKEKKVSLNMALELNNESIIDTANKVEENKPKKKIAVKKNKDVEEVIINENEIIEDKPKNVRGLKKVRKIEDRSYLRLPEKNAIKKLENINIEPEIEELIKNVQNKIKALHQILWEIEKMDGEEALDEIIKLLFLRYLQNLITDKEGEPNKIDLLNPIYHKNILIDGDNSDKENFEEAKRYLLNFKLMYDDIEKARRGLLIENGKKISKSDIMDTIFNPDSEKNDIFKIITKIFKNHPITKELYTQNTFLAIKNQITLEKILELLYDNCFDNSKNIPDLMGEIYEYFLNKYNKKKSNLGQFFTARMLMNSGIKYKKDKIYEIMIRKEKPIASDKCMGTAGWLVKLYNDFKEINKNILLHGREFKPNTYLYGIINLISTIGKMPYECSVGCSLSNVENFQLDLICSNPPFTGKEELKKLNKLYLKNRREGFNKPNFEDIYFLNGEDNTSLMFLQLYIHQLAPGGLCMIVLPYGELFSKDSKSMIEVRKKLLDKIDITDIIICPPGIFTHTDVKVCMFIFENNPGGTKEIKFSKFLFDETNTILDKIKHLTTVKRKDIMKEPINSFYHMDYLYDELADNLQNEMNNYEWVEFGDVFDLVKGQISSEKIEHDENGEFPFVTKAIENDWKKINSYTNIGESLFIAELDGGNKIPIRYTNLNNTHSDLMLKAELKNNYKNNKINLKYIYYYLLSLQEHITNEYEKGSCFPRLDIKNLYRMKIPIPSISIQNNIIIKLNSANEKIKGLQNIVDIMKNTDIPLIFEFGSKSCIAKTEWIEFGDVFDLVKGQLQSSKVEEDENGNGVFINLSKTGNFKKIKEPQYNDESIFISNTSPLGLIQYYDGKYSYSDLLLKLILNSNYKNKLNLKFIYYYLLSIKNHIEETYQKGSCNQTLDIKNLSRMKIPIIPIERQDEVIKDITDVEEIIKKWEIDIENIKNKDARNVIYFLEQENIKQNNENNKII